MPLRLRILETLLHHLEQTKGHVNWLDLVFEGIGEKPKARKCDGVRGIIDEGEDLISQKGDHSVIDAGLIALDGFNSPLFSST